MQPSLKPRQPVGRPRKLPARGQRSPLSLLITPRLKRRIAQLADSNGTTLSSQAEYLIETAITMTTMLDAMNKTLEQITAGTLDTAMRKRGLVSRRIVTGGKSWVIWADPDFPVAASGFEEWTPEELEAQRARET